MSDTLGRIAVPTPVASDLVFPLVSEFGYSAARTFPTIEHRFGELATLGTQRFQAGIGPRRFAFRRQSLNRIDRVSLASFFEATQGNYQSFLYDAPQADKTFTRYRVLFDEQPLTFNDLATRSQVGLTFVECGDADTAPAYGISETCLRFPSAGLADALLSQVQQIIPLVHIKVREPGVPDIYLSDRRCSVGANAYLPRLLNIGEPGGEVIMAQTMNGGSDTVQFTFGNADRAMTQLANDTDLTNAEIDLCLYNVLTGSLLQLWKGFINDYSIADCSPQFSVTASDGLYWVTQQYPAHPVSKYCWKTFNDGVNCPYASKGRGGNPAECDFTFGLDPTGAEVSGANGCFQHGMTQFFGAQPLRPQPVKIKDNSSGGVFKIGRNTVTATSLLSESMYGKPLPDIWCNQGDDPGKAFQANAIPASIRDEGDFTKCIAIIGAGPLYAFSGIGVTRNLDGFPVVISPTFDGQLPQGFSVDSDFQASHVNGPLGIRASLGTDPTDQTEIDDTFAPSAGGATKETGPDGKVRQIPERAAGTAFLEIVVPKPSGITPSAPESHQVTVPVAQGLGGRRWDGGSPVWANGLTNPFWIAINTLLRGSGIAPQEKDASDRVALQEALFVKQSASDCAGIADIMVDPLVGNPDAASDDPNSPLGDNDGDEEPQWQFQGTIAQQKPLRDQLVEILGGACGFFTWEFGKFKVGIRENASAVSAFTRGNMIYGSLRLNPIRPAFEGLRIDFANRNYQFQADFAEYVDKSHAAYYGRQGSPLTSSMHLVGCCTLSQAARLAVIRTREEIGGVNPAEWASARIATWRTTVLALDTEVGQVVSLTHPNVPGGFAHFRIESWRLLKDWSIEIQARSVTPSMYELEAGPKPADVGAAPLPVLFYPEPLGTWAPYEVQAEMTDALFKEEWNLAAKATYPSGAEKGTLSVRGKLPVNSFIPDCGAAVLNRGFLSTSDTNGLLPGGVTLRIQVCAKNADGKLSPPSDVVLVRTKAGGDFNQVQIGRVRWPEAAGLTRYVIFAYSADDLISAQFEDDLVADENGGYSPTTIVLNGPIERSTWGVPNQSIANVRLKAKEILHAGAVGFKVQSVSGNTVTCSDVADSTGQDNWTGRYLITIGRSDNGTTDVPFVTRKIRSFDPTIGRFVIDDGITRPRSNRPQQFQVQNAFVPHRPDISINPGDILVVSARGYDNSANPYRIEDPGFSNSSNYRQADPLSPHLPAPHAGLQAHDPKESSAIIRVIVGKSRGKTAKVLDNDSIGYTLATPLLIDETSVWIVEEATWRYSVDSTPVSNSDPFKSSVLPIPIPQYPGQTLLVAGFTVDNDEKESGETDAPLRIVFVNGSQGVVYAVSTETENSFQKIIMGKPAFKFSFGNGTDGGPADLVVGDTTDPVEVNDLQTIYGWSAVTDEAPTGSSATFDITQNGVSIFGSGPKVTLDAGAIKQNGFDFNGVIQFQPGDKLQGRVATVGSGTPGKRTVVNLYAYKM